MIFNAFPRTKSIQPTFTNSTRTNLILFCISGEFLLVILAAFLVRLGTKKEKTGTKKQKNGHRKQKTGAKNRKRRGKTIKMQKKRRWWVIFCGFCAFRLLLWCFWVLSGSSTSAFCVLWCALVISGCSISAFCVICGAFGAIRLFYE